ncbi:MAG: hypothetical protein IT245_09340 [Bacteroidia bacterium]|nr:hypothetical protein [Bacteroidia bacterium]
MISSCGSLSISQKRYSNGLNLNWFGAKEDKLASNQSTTKKKSKKVKSTALNIPLSDSTQFIVDNVEVSTLNNQLAIPPTNVVNAEKIRVKNLKRQILIYKFNPIQHSAKTQLTEKYNAPESSSSTHESGGLKFIGWFLIILGLIFLLVINIVVGLLFMLLGLLFVVAGS